MIDPVGSQPLAENIARSGQSVAPPKSGTPRTAAPIMAAAETAGVMVELSLMSQAKLLKSQGQSISVIAATLGLDLTTVSSYFPGVSG